MATHASREAWEWMGSTIQLLHSVTSTCLLSEPAVAVLDQDQDLLQDPGSCTTQSSIWYRCCCPHHIQHCLTHSLLSLFLFLSFQLCKSRELKINSINQSLPADLVRSSLPELGSAWFWLMKGSSSSPHVGFVCFCFFYIVCIVIYCIVIILFVYVSKCMCMSDNAVDSLNKDLRSALNVDGATLAPSSSLFPDHWHRFLTAEELRSRTTRR